MSATMRVAGGLSLLILMMAGGANAQLHGGGRSGFGGAVVVGPAPIPLGRSPRVIGRPTPGRLGHGGLFPRHSRLRPFAPVLYPFFPYFDYYPEYPEAEVEPAAPQVVIIREPQPQPAAPAAPAPNPEVTEISPQPTGRIHTAAQSEEKGPAVFLLRNGREVQARRYTITDRYVYLAAAHNQTLKIPLDDVNLEATLARNRQQGIDLRIPSAPSEYFLSF